MKNQAGIDDHTQNAAALAAGYARIDRNCVHPRLFEHLTSDAQAGRVLDVLDIGAGSGDDAFAMAQLGHKVTAVEPSALLDIAIRDHSRPNITYVRDSLPDLTSQHDKQYDVILLSAVWQYIDPSERSASLKTIAGLLRPHGKVVVTFPSPPSREFQFEIDENTFRQELEAVNQQLPKHQRMKIAGVPVVTPDSRGRKSKDGKDLNFYSFTIEGTGHAESLSQEPPAKRQAQQR